MHRRYASSPVSPFNYINLYSFDSSGGRKGRELYYVYGKNDIWKEAERLGIEVGEGREKRANFIACKKEKKKKRKVSEFLVKFSIKRSVFRCRRLNNFSSPSLLQLDFPSNLFVLPSSHFPYPCFSPPKLAKRRLHYI